MAARNQGLTREGTLNLLATTAQNAPIAANQQTQQLRNQHLADLDKINQQRASVIRQAGTYATGRIGDLVTDDRKLRHDLNAQLRQLDVQRRGQDLQSETTRRGQTLSHEDRQASIQQRRDAAAQRGGRRLPGGVKRRTQAAHSELKTKIDADLDRVDGIPGGTVHDPATGRVKIDPKTGLAKQAPAVKPVGALQRGVILDLIYDGHVSRRHVNELHRQGYSLGQLGYPTRSRRTSAGRPPVTPGPAGTTGNRPT